MTFTESLTPAPIYLISGKPKLERPICNKYFMQFLLGTSSAYSRKFMWLPIGQDDRCANVNRPRWDALLLTLFPGVMAIAPFSCHIPHYNISILVENKHGNIHTLRTAMLAWDFGVYLPFQAGLNMTIQSSDKEIFPPKMHLNGVTAMFLLDMESLRYWNVLQWHLMKHVISWIRDSLPQCNW